ncbi:unnamed protein product, partial [Laminaria digitata]
GLAQPLHVRRHVHFHRARPHRREPLRAPHLGRQGDIHVGGQRLLPPKGRGRLHGPAHLPRRGGDVQEPAHRLARPVRHRHGGVGGGQDGGGETADAFRHHRGNVQR